MEQIIHTYDQEHQADIDGMVQRRKNTKQASFQKALPCQTVVVGQRVDHIVVADLEDILVNRDTAGNKPTQQDHCIEVLHEFAQACPLPSVRTGIKQREFNERPAD